MSKKIISLLLLSVMFVVNCSVSVMADSTSRSVAYAGYGTPVIDGEIDEIWSKTPGYSVENCSDTGEKFYKGWFKVLWDENYMYVLAKEYTSSFDDFNTDPWYHDSVDVYFDEKADRGSPYSTDDYQVRCNFNSLVSGNNYPDFTKVEAKNTIHDNYFVSEIAIPLVTVSPSENLTMGFEVLMTASPALGMKSRTYLWNTKSDWTWNNTDCYGTIVLQKNPSVNSESSYETESWTAQVSEDGYDEEEKEVEYVFVGNVTSYFDSKTSVNPIIYADEYPMMEISNLAKLIEGSCSGNTISKNGLSVTFTDGDRLAQFGDGHLMLERAPKMFNGSFYVPVSFVIPVFKYTMHYNRFDKVLEIKTGTDYPEPVVTFYAKDFGAVGDGVHDDREAITCAIDAALTSGLPARVELEAGKTYLLGSRSDNLQCFVIEDAQNITIDGMGSELLFEKPTNSFLEIERSANIKVQNLSVDYKELPFTQGRITSLDSKAGTFEVVFDEGYPLPASNEWVKYHWAKNTLSGGGWWFTQLMDPVKDRLKYNMYDQMMIDTIDKVDGRKYIVKLLSGYEGRLNEADVGDRVVINTRYSAYDVGDWTHNGQLHGMIFIGESGDITIENVDIYCSPWHGVNVGDCWGRINLIGYGMLTKPGRLMSTNSDGIHYWNNREGIVLEDSVLMNNLDDHLNTYGNPAMVSKILDTEGTSFKVTRDQHYRVGDEVVFYNPKSDHILGRAFVKSYERISGSEVNITFDRKIENVLVNDGSPSSTIVYNLNCCGQGSVVRNTKFIYSRRHAYLCNSRNSLIEGNEVIECAGGAFVLRDEARTGGGQGTHPSATTIRNNKVSMPGNTPPFVPLWICSCDGGNEAQAAIDGVLIENNYFSTNNPKNVAKISAVKDLYMLNNTFEISGEVNHTMLPVEITNSKVQKVDGMKLISDYKIATFITVAGCSADESKFTNIEVSAESGAKNLEIK